MTFKPTLNKGTGPYRRVWLKPGYSCLAADITLPGGKDLCMVGADGHALPSQDTAYVYMGGWPCTGHDVDAGFLYSPKGDNWSLFLKADGHPDAIDPVPFAPGLVHLKFEVNPICKSSETPPVGAELRLTATTKGVPGQANTGRVMLIHLYGKGWEDTGNCVLKMVTSIAQGPEDLKSGAYLHGVRWQDIQAWSASDRALVNKPQVGGAHVHPVAREMMSGMSYGYITAKPLPDGGEIVWIDCSRHVP